MVEIDFEIQQNTYSIHEFISIVAVNCHFRQKCRQPEHRHNTFDYSQIVLQKQTSIVKLIVYLGSFIFHYRHQKEC